MKVIDYRVTYNFGGTEHETVRVKARDINSGFAKALKLAKEPLGNGHVREIVSIEFWEVK